MHQMNIRSQIVKINVVDKSVAFEVVEWVTWKTPYQRIIGIWEEA